MPCVSTPAHHPRPLLRQSRFRTPHIYFAWVLNGGLFFFLAVLTFSFYLTLRDTVDAGEMVTTFLLGLILQPLMFSVLIIVGRNM